MAPRSGTETCYGFPLYGASWIPLAHILNPDDDAADADASSPPPRHMAVLGGGGGEGNNRVPNALVVAALDPAVPTGLDPAAPLALSPKPVFRLGTGQQVPYRMSVHPRGDGVICAFPNGCRLLRWEIPEEDDPHELVLRSDEEAVVNLRDVGLQLAVSFSGAGSVLATGGEDGHLRVFKWPTMESIIEATDTKTSVKDLSFSSDEKFLAVNRSSGPSRVWDLKSAEAVANLPRETGEIFGFCRFCNKPDNSQILFITAMQGDYGRIISWNTTSWTRIGSKKITRDAISAFAVSPDSTLLAFGTVEGSVSILRSRDMRVLEKVKEAHLGTVTSLAFSQDSRTLLSTSFDSTARVTWIGPPRSPTGVRLYCICLAILVLAMAFRPSIIIRTDMTTGFMMVALILAYLGYPFFTRHSRFVR
ncbi:unnamed protein product [Alopecurus aequalis]